VSDSAGLHIAYFTSVSFSGVSVSMTTQLQINSITESGGAGVKLARD
jgi:hypothetical protein